MTVLLCLVCPVPRQPPQGVEMTEPFPPQRRQVERITNGPVFTVSCSGTAASTVRHTLQDVTSHTLQDVTSHATQAKRVWRDSVMHSIYYYSLCINE